MGRGEGEGGRRKGGERASEGKTVSIAFEQAHSSCEMLGNADGAQCIAVAPAINLRHKISANQVSAGMITLFWMCAFSPASSVVILSLTFDSVSLILSCASLPPATDIGPCIIEVSPFHTLAVAVWPATQSTL